jgi:hypothetical protein
VAINHLKMSFAAAWGHQGTTHMICVHARLREMYKMCCEAVSFVTFQPWPPVSLRLFYLPYLLGPSMVCVSSCGMSHELMLLFRALGTLPDAIDDSRLQQRPPP